MFLETDRLLLRKFREADFSDFCDYAIVHKQTEKVIGGLTVYNAPPSHVTSMEALKGKKGASLSFGIAKPFRRQGLMYEAVSAVIAHLFKDEGLDYVNAGYVDFNTPSQRLQNKLGFSYLTTERFGEGEKMVTVIESILWRKQYRF